jgi:NAD-dependent oxidoreductase involved in siderophore biosynthesis
MGARARYEHVGQALGHLRRVSTVALKDLGVEAAFTIAGHLQVLNPTRGRYQITSVGAVAVAFPLGAALTPADPDERVKLLAHHIFQHHTNGATGQFAHMLPKCVLIWQSRDRLLLP